MNKKVMMYFLGLVWVAVLLQLVVVAGTKNDSKVVQAFQAVDSVPVQSVITVNGTYDEYLVSEESQKKLCSYIANGLHITNYKLDWQEADEQSVLVLTSGNDSAQTKIMLWDENGTQSVSTTITLNQRTDCVIEVKERVQEVYRRLDMEPDIHFSMEGVLSGELDEGRRDQIREQIFRVLETQLVKQQECSGAHICYGYSSVVTDVRQMDGKKVNVQLVFSYDEEKQQTRLYLGVPLFQDGF